MHEDVLVCASLSVCAYVASAVKYVFFIHCFIVVGDDIFPFFVFLPSLFFSFCLLYTNEIVQGAW